MSSREPLWYCHECHAEMRPLMVPDPHCASCNGTFVEKMDNPTDDPREFQEDFGGELDDGELNDPFLAGLQNILGAASRPPPVRSSTRPQPSTPRPPERSNSTPVSTSSSYSIRIDRTNNGTTRTVFTSGSGRPEGGSGIPRLSEFVSQNTGQRPGADGGITGPLMLQYLLAMLANQPGRGGEVPAFMPGLFPPGFENGRMGDYVFNQEALDQIITQLMENSSSHPVPATEDVMEKLPREVLEEGSPILEKDCAVCKDQFALNTEDPDEQVVVTLPCKHPFHEPCIMPWLKSSATCPVCRYELVAQPHPHGPPNPGSRNPNPNSNRAAGNDDTNAAEGSSSAGGLFSNFFQFMANAASGGSSNEHGDHDEGTSSNRTSSPSHGGRRSSTHRRSSSDGDDRRSPPGGWGAELD